MTKPTPVENVAQAEPAPPARSPTQPIFFLALLLALVTSALFWPTVKSSFISWDDPEYVTQNARVLSGLSWENVRWAFTTGYAGNWHPLTWISHMLDVHWFGLKPGGHHLHSLLLHTANSVLLFLLVYMMTRTPWRSVFVAALFALHPLHVESVAWVSERKDLLSGFFFMLTLLAYVAYARRRSPVSNTRENEDDGTVFQARNPVVFYGLALICFAFGLMSKPMLVTVPFVLLLLDYWPLGRLSFRAGQTNSRVYRTLLLEKVPFFALTIASSIITFLVQDAGKAVGSMADLPFGPRLANAIAAWFQYLAKTFWPDNLAVVYPHPYMLNPPVDAWPLSYTVLAAALLLGISVGAVLRLRSEPWLATGWFWFLGMLVPVIGLVQVGSQAMADRYMYLPIIGLFLCVTWIVAETFSGRPAARICLPVVAGIALLGCGILSVRQVRIWRNGLTLFGYTLAVTRNNAVAHFNYAYELKERGRLEEAIEHLREAVRIAPYYLDAQGNLGLAYLSTGKPAEAAEVFTRVLERAPDHYRAQQGLGAALAALGRHEEAIAAYTVAAGMDPASPLPPFNIGAVLSEMGRFAEAVPHFEKAIQLHPANVEAQLGLANAWMGQGENEKAIAALEKALRLAPDSPGIRVSIGSALMSAGRTEEAAGHFAEALKLQRDLPEAALAEARNFAARGQLDLAISRANIALNLAPESVEAHEVLGMLQAQTGRFEEARRQFREVLRLRPDAQSHYNLGLLEVMRTNHSGALVAFREAVKLQPDWSPALNDLAWLLATHPDASVRNGAEAVGLAERACALAGESQPRFFGTLDAAYAEAGRFDDAIKTAEKVMTLAAKTGETNLIQAAESRLALYRQGRPFHQPPP